ncbi:MULTISPECIES: SatD family protein [unclassified Nocardioides]|uniref:SatD family protein n=1 Tax=unclassified Nocardioides TaxID=2615069 RepID=UPI000AA96761|nr:MULTISPECIES: SatD family protein [unclassified Nocardioides]
MAGMKQDATVTLIGDVVGSRVPDDRAVVHARLEEALADVNTELSPAVPLWITAGDEYQATFARLGDALAATLRLRLALLPDLDVRHGLGWGAVTVLGTSPRIEDGPGWWAARKAIVRVSTDAGRASLGRVRTAFEVADDAARPDAAAINAALLGRDGLVGAMSARSLSVLRGLLSGQTQREVAETEGVSASAVSQRVRHDGIALVVAIDEQLRGIE